MRTAETVLIMGSAPDVLRARDWPRDGIASIVAINNAWAVRPDWDVTIHPDDFPTERRPKRLRRGQVLAGPRDFVPAVNAHGGFVYAGGTMAFTAGYWALHALKPRLMAYLGCDMIYATAQASHFYGRGNPDPLRPDPTLQSLEAKSARLQLFAAEAGCAVVNLSDLPTSRQVFPRITQSELAGWTAARGDQVRAQALTPRSRALAQRARAEEARLGYAAPDGKYWKALARFDPAALRAIDALWLAAAGPLAVAA